MQLDNENNAFNLSIVLPIPKSMQATLYANILRLTVY